MKVYILIKDEIGDRFIFGVYTSYDLAKAVGDWEIEKAQDWIDSMHSVNESVGNWVPRFYIEESDLISD